MDDQKVLYDRACAREALSQKGNMDWPDAKLAPTHYGAKQKAARNASRAPCGMLSLVTAVWTVFAVPSCVAYTLHTKQTLATQMHAMNVSLSRYMVQRYVELVR